MVKMHMFVAGPVNASDKVKSLKQFEEIGHREPEFQKIYYDIKNNLHKVFKANKKDFDIVIIGGSGTAAMETTIASVCEYPLVISNGAFGERMSEICNIYKITHSELHYAWGQYPNLKSIERILKLNSMIKEVCMVYMETSTGMLNPLKEIGKLCKKYNKKFIVDAVCALGVENFSMKNIDFCFASSNKGIGGPPVVGFICCRKSKLNGLKRRSFYLDLNSIIHYSHKNQTHTTPPIPTYYMLRDTLKEALREGLNNRIKRYRNNHKLLRNEMKKIGLKTHLIGHMSHAMTNYIIPEGFTFEYIHHQMKKKGFLIYAGKGELDGKVMHIATIGNLKKKDILEFVNTMKVVIK